MKNGSNLTKDEKEKLAQEYLFSTLHRLNFDILTLGRFFKHVHEAHQNQKALLETIEGGTSYPTNSYAPVSRSFKKVGEWGDYYIVEFKEPEGSDERHQKVMCAYKREALLVRTKLFETLLRRVAWQEELRKFADCCGDLSLSVATAKKHKDDRQIIRFGAIQVLLCGEQMEKQNVTEFRQVTVPYWRQALETLRVQLHLLGKHTYNQEVQQADLFLRILESNN